LIHGFVYDVGKLLGCFYLFVENAKSDVFEENNFLWLIVHHDILYDNIHQKVFVVLFFEILNMKRTKVSIIPF
jgi:hypothetical protein